MFTNPTVFLRLASLLLLGVAAALLLAMVLLPVFAYIMES
jgi:predicted RND superfamily exporter protein